MKNVSLPRIDEETSLVEFDENGRTYKLHPEALVAWLKMKVAAESANVSLALVSAFRSIARQSEIIETKRAKGLSDFEIFQFSAKPGYSEHHSGRAIDVTTEGFPLLEHVFDRSLAFNWLQDNAPRFGYYMSYPKNNDYGIAYEPWHWMYRKESAYPVK